MFTERVIHCLYLIFRILLLLYSSPVCRELICGQKSKELFDILGNICYLDQRISALALSSVWFILELQQLITILIVN